MERSHPWLLPLGTSAFPGMMRTGFEQIRIE